LPISVFVFPSFSHSSPPCASEADPFYGLVLALLPPGKRLRSFPFPSRQLCSLRQRCGLTTMIDHMSPAAAVPSFRRSCTSSLKCLDVSCGSVCCRVKPFFSRNPFQVSVLQESQSSVRVAVSCRGLSLYVVCLFRTRIWQREENQPRSPHDLIFPTSS